MMPKWLLAGMVLLPALTLSAQPLRATDRYAFVYTVKLPKLERPATMWWPLATRDRFQKVMTIRLPKVAAQRIVTDSCGNRILVLQLTAADSERVLDAKYLVSRSEKSTYAVPDEDVRRWLQSPRLAMITDELRAVAAKATAGKTTDTDKARALYDHVLDHMQYDKTGEGWGRGDAVRACTVGVGNCTDYHAYFNALARASGLPARFAIGFSIPTNSIDGEIGGYHCWSEVLTDGKWLPVDISEADQDPATVDYYFGHHPGNRLQLTVGRDLVIDPAPKSGPPNFLVYPLLEVGGQVVEVATTFTYQRLADRQR